MRYEKHEILEIIRANHKQRLQIESWYPTAEEIDFDLKIQDWIDEFDLVDGEAFNKYYANLFKVKYDEKEWKSLKITKREGTIEDFCEFVSLRAKKPKIKAKKLFGNECEKAGIFLYLKGQLKLESKNDRRINEIKPSSHLADYMNDIGFNIIEEVNLISPEILPLVKFEDNNCLLYTSPSPRDS